MEESTRDRDTGANYSRDQSPMQAVMPLKEEEEKKKTVFKIN
jgi:hypothetical protein